MSHDDCVFCDIINGDEDVEILNESDDFLCFLDAYPVTEGHALVIPKHHIRYLEETDNNQIFEFLRESLELVKTRFDPDATNIGFNNGAEAGQTVPHLHGHIIPRYDGDMENPEGGVRGVIPEKQKY